MRADGNSGNCCAFCKFFGDIEQLDRIPVPVANTPFRRRQMADMARCALLDRSRGPDEAAIAHTQCRSQTPSALHRTWWAAGDAIIGLSWHPLERARSLLHIASCNGLGRSAW
jgi:hypothetical protein